MRAFMHILASMWAVVGLAGGCASSDAHSLVPNRAGANAGANAAALRQQEPAAETSTRSPASEFYGTASALPAAMWNNDAISFDEMRPRLMEAAGSGILEELLLERALEKELALKSISIDDAAIAAEEAAALAALAPDRSRAEQLLNRLRTLQGMGAVRWKALLKRNAGLRALARASSGISEENIRQAYDARHGPKRSARLIVATDLAQAQAALSRLDAGEPFGEVAATLSTDASASRGGLLAPISQLDHSYPQAVRDTLFALKVGARSDPILIDGGYAIIELRAEIPGDGAEPSAVRNECEAAARLAQERVEMDRIARGLVRDARPTLFDASLEDSWRRSQESRRE